MADTVGVPKFRPKKLKKKGNKAIKGLAGIGGALAGNYLQVPSITKAVTGEEDDVIDLAAEMGIIVGGEKGAKKAAQTELLKKLLGKFTKGMGKRAALGAIPAIGPYIAGGYAVGSLGTTAKWLYDLPKEERDKYIEAIKQSPQIINSLAKENRAKTQTRFKKQIDRSKAPAFRSTKKKGGRVGRPKGVGRATKGFGKAMKRGK